MPSQFACYYDWTTDMPAPLSPNTYPEGLWREGYKICLEFESKAIMISTPLPSSDPSCLVCARFLGYMILEAPTDRGRDNISRQIIDCVDEDELVELMRFCIGHFVRCGERPLYLSRPVSSDATHQSVLGWRITPPVPRSIFHAHLSLMSNACKILFTKALGFMLKPRKW
jgi:hypothetical protein